MHGQLFARTGRNECADERLADGLLGGQRNRGVAGRVDSVGIDVISAGHDAVLDGEDGRPAGRRAAEREDHAAAAGRVGLGHQQHRARGARGQQIRGGIVEPIVRAVESQSGQAADSVRNENRLAVNVGLLAIAMGPALVAPGGNRLTVFGRSLPGIQGPAVGGQPEDESGSRWVASQLPAIRAVGKLPGQPPPSVGQLLGHQRSVDQLQSLGQLGRRRAFALADRLAAGLAENFEKIGARIRPGELRGARAGRQARIFFRHAGDRAHRIEQLLGREEPGTGMGKVALVRAIERGGLAAQLVGPTGENRANDMPLIEALRDEVVGQRLEQLGNRRGVRLAEVIHRIDEAPAQQVSPDAIDTHFGEQRIAGSGEPVGQHAAGVLAGRNVDVAGQRQPGADRFLGVRLNGFAGLGHPDEHFVGHVGFLALDAAEQALMP